MKRTILLKGARIIDPSQNLDTPGDLLVAEGKIRDIGQEIVPPEGARVIELSGKWVVPGLVDMHVHLREPGEEYKETIATGAEAAVCGGFTSLACMPNTRPVNDTATVTRFILDRAKQAGLARVYPVAAITMAQKGRDLTEFADLLAAGAVAFSDDGLPVQDAGMMRRALEYAFTFKALIISHSEEMSLSQDGLMNEGRVSTLLGLKGIPRAAEETAIFRDIALAELTGSRIHIAHVSTAGSIEIIRRAKERGVRVTAETAPHYFSLTEEAVMGYNTNAKMNPPLRTEEDRIAVIEGLADGTLDAIASDHAPHSTIEKECEFQLAANGIIGLETSLPLAMELVRLGRITPSRMVELLATGPAEILNIEAGTLRKGAAADICVIDPDRSFEVTPDFLHSKSKNSPFLGRTLKGRAVLTMVDGRVVFDLDGLLSTQQPTIH